MGAETLDAYRGFSYEVAEQIAPTWEARREDIEGVAAPVREWMLRELRPQPGDTVLELAAGTGDTGFEAAARVGERGRLISSDFSPAMLEAARRRGAELGIDNVEYRILDAERIELDADSVDGVLCRFGYMLMADPAAALAETRRVLRRSGRLAFAVWAAAQRNPWAAIPASTMVELGHGVPPDSDAPGPFTMADPEVISALVGAAGFGKPDIEDVPVSWNYADADEHWTRTITLSQSTAQRLRELSEAERELVRETVKERVEERLAQGREEMNGVALVVTCE